MRAIPTGWRHVYRPSVAVLVGLPPCRPRSRSPQHDRGSEAGDSACSEYDHGIDNETFTDRSIEPEPAASADASTRSQLLAAFRDLLDRLDTGLIEQDEADDHADHTA